MASKKRIPGIFCFMKSKIVKKPHNAACKRRFPLGGGNDMINYFTVIWNFLSPALTW